MRMRLWVSRRRAYDPETLRPEIATHTARFCPCCMATSPTDVRRRNRRRRRSVRGRDIARAARQPGVWRFLSGLSTLPLQPRVWIFGSDFAHGPGVNWWLTRFFANLAIFRYPVAGRAAISPSRRLVSRGSLTDKHRAFLPQPYQTWVAMGSGGCGWRNISDTRFALLGVGC